MLPDFKHSFVKLPINFDVARLQREVNNLLEMDWLAHPEGFDGNCSLPLVSVKGQYNHEFAIAGQMLPTSALCKSPYIQHVLTSLNLPISRTRLMLLDKQKDVKRHFDGGYHWYRRLRIHIPVFTHPDVIFGCGTEQVHMSPGEVWCFNHKNWHWVQNDSDFARIHLVIDTKGNHTLFEYLDDPTTKEFSLFNKRNSASMLLEPYRFEVFEPNEWFALTDQIIESLREHKNIAGIDVLTKCQVQWFDAFRHLGHNQHGEEEYSSIIDTVINTVDRCTLNLGAKLAIDSISSLFHRRNGVPIRALPCRDISI